MAGIPFGALAGGISQGLEQGQNMRARQIAIQDELRQRAAQDAASNWLQQIGSQPDQPQAPMPGAVPQPAVPPQQGPMPGAPPQGAPPPPMVGGGGPPQQVPMPGAMPMAPPPQAGPPPGPMPPQGAPPGGQPPMAPPQGAPPAAPPGGQPPAPGLSGASQPSGDVFADAKRTIQSISKGILQANPGRKWKPGEFMDAVNAGIKVMEGVNPLEKIAAQAQIAGAKAQYDYWHANQVHEDKSASLVERTAKDESAHEDRLARIDADFKRAKMTSDSREKIASMSNATRLQAAEIVQSGADERMNKTLDFRQKALDAGLDEKEWQANLTAQLKEEGMNDAFISKLFSAQSAAGQAPAAPKQPLRKPLPSAPARGAAPAGGGGKPIPAATMTQWGQVPAANKAAAKNYLADQGYDVSGLR